MSAQIINSSLADEMPLAFGVWTLTAANSSNQLAFDMTARGKRRPWLRVLWYVFWLVVFLVVSVGTLVSNIALPNAGTLLPYPELLPWLGLGIAVILVGVVLNLLYKIWNQASRITVELSDVGLAELKAWRGKRLMWSVAGADVDSVYVSEMIKKKDKSYVTYHGELNLHMKDDDFKFVLQQGVEDRNTNARKDISNQYASERVSPLTEESANTDLQVSGVLLADVLGHKKCLYDLRLK